jgi:uncharacterized membrane protein YhaH (DUF805 family)
MNNRKWRKKMEWYLLPWKRFAEFSGRSRRKEYWMFFLFNMVIGLVLYVPGIALRESGIGPIFLGLYAIYSLAALIPGLAVSVRRLHDTNKSGWFFLLLLIPFVGPIILLVFFCMDSDAAANQYGPNPKLA